MGKTVAPHEICTAGVLGCRLWICLAVVESLSRVRLFATPWTAARQASLSFTISLGVALTWVHILTLLLKGLFFPSLALVLLICSAGPS